MISFTGVSKRYGKQHALNNISFTVPKGQILGLLGQNGAGKTTTMNIMTGCLAPSGGTVSIDGHDILLDARAAKRQIGYLPEQAPLYDEMLVQDYLRFVCRLREMVPQDIPDHAAMIGKQAGLQDVMGRRISNLSKGYRQRVGFAQALCALPPVIVLDEPTVGLDPLQTTEFRKLVRGLQGKHTVIFSSHILSEVQTLCDRILILHQGQLICDSAMNDLHDGEITLRATIVMGADQLLPALRSLSGVTRVTKVPGEEPGETTVLISAPRDVQIERRLFTLLSGLQAPLLRLAPTQDSLEDIFVRITQGAQISKQ